MTAQEARKITEEKEIKIHAAQYAKIIEQIKAVIENENSCAREAWVYGFTPLPSVRKALERDGYKVHDTISNFKDGIMTRIEW